MSKKKSYTEIKKKSLEEIKSLTTKRLLEYFKSVRVKVYRHVDSFYCECCGTPSWELMSKHTTKEDKKLEKERCLNLIKDAEDYLDIIKAELNTRENVKNKK
jgi:hypothetical protein